MIATFKVGQLVLKLIPVKPQGITKGFWKPWDGPFRIVDVKSDIVYKVKRCQEPFDEHIANIETLREYDEREETRYIEYSLERKNRFAFSRKNFRDKCKDDNSCQESSEQRDSNDEVTVLIQGRSSLIPEIQEVRASREPVQECKIEIPLNVTYIYVQARKSIIRNQHEYFKPRSKLYISWTRKIMLVHGKILSR
ncbi:hypothetical protein HDE_04441 [Halotydeus destructor]|nr:hypothetical protein HDE_04441 [Halotydeus destructor]